MSMTRKEAITQLELLLEYCESMMTSEDPVWRRDCEALRMLIAALRPIGREQLDVVINSLKLRLENNEENGIVSIPKFAVEQMIERLEAIKNG